MKRPTFSKIIPLLLFALILFSGCASKRYAKKGLEFEKAGMYEKASEMYYISVTKNPKNLKAQVGLHKTAQITLDNKVEQFMGFYTADEIKDAVYKYVELDAYNQKMKGVQLELTLSGEIKEHYLEVKAIYLERRYNEAYLLLEQEKFSESETILNEILAIDPAYQDAANLKNTAHFEPIYRKAKDLMEVQKYRSSYKTFQQILSKIPVYKDAKDLSDEVLRKALLTIGVVDFGNNTRQKGIEVQVQSQVEKNINATTSPFIKLVDRQNTARITREQLLSLEGKVDETVRAEAGKMLGVKAILTGDVTYYNMNISPLSKTEKKGYTKEVIKINKPEGSKDSAVYHKTIYYEYEQRVTVSLSFQFKLISVETGEILITDAITSEQNDEVHYAAFDGDRSKLIPGYWEQKDKKSANDVVKDTSGEKRKLDDLLNERKQLKSSDAMSLDAQQFIAKKVVQKIESYDPER